MKPSFRISCFVAILFQWMVSINGLTFKLDLQEKGNNDVWTISGNYSYYDSAKELLGRPSSFLPSNFNYDKIIRESGVGIWMVHPKHASKCKDAESAPQGYRYEDFENELKENNTVHQGPSYLKELMNLKETSTTTTTTAPTIKPSCDVSASASFVFALRHQLLDSVTIKYSFGGNATLRMTGNSRHSMLIPANYSRMNEWGNVTLPVDGSKMLLEAIVNTTGDFILIDSITVETLQASTTSTTHRPKHHSTSSSGPSTSTKGIPSTTTTQPTKRPSPRTQPSTTTKTAADVTTTTATTTEQPLTTANPEPAPVSGQNRVSSGVLLSYLWIVTIFAKFAM